MPTARRSRTVAAPPERVWGTVGDPYHLPRWWPRVTRVEAVTALADLARDLRVDVVIGAEARGFLLGPAIARELGAGFVLARKPGKLPHDTVRAEYVLEYATDALELHSDAVATGARVLVHDDLLATGGTAKALCELVEQLDGQVVACAFLIELAFLHGRENLAGYDVRALLRFDSE